MLKIKDNVDLKELKKYGFDILYNKYTGEPEDIYLSYGFPYKKPFIIFSKKKAKLIFRDIRNEKWGMDIEVPNNRSDRRYFLNVLYDLIKADLVEKVED